MAITLNEDDTFDGSVVMAFSDEVAESMGSDPQELWDQMGSEMESEMPEGATQEPYAQDGYTGTKITYATSRSRSSTPAPPTRSPSPARATSTS